MCGIGGWFSPQPQRPDAEQRLERVRRMLAHRGPDGHGTCIAGHAAFAHTRLAVIDPEGGVQPLHAADGGGTIIFNGEIYNYAGERERLRRRGVAFRTRSDTEVLLQAWLDEGVAGLARLRGMFACAIWDARQQVGVLVRDPLGIKPLFYRHDPDGTLWFGSEVKAVLSTAGGRAELDPQALHLLLNFRYLPGSRSLFRGVRQLPPGGILIWGRDGRVREMRIPAPEPGQGTAPMEAVRDSVQAHLVADVPVAAYLSGGLDSAAVVAMAGRRLPTFTVAAGDDPREAEHAARTATLLGVPNRRLPVRFDPVADLRRMVWHLETPKVNALQVWLLARATSEHVKVALSGLGGDELFYGYRAHQIMDRAWRASGWLPGAVRKGLGASAARLVQGLARAPHGEPERALRMLAALGDWPRVYGWLRNLWDSPALRRTIYGPRLLDERLPDAFEVLRGGWPQERDPVRAMALWERREKLVNDLLWNEDRMSMAFGLEVRVPFVDRPLWCAVDALPRARLMPRGRPKGWFREALREVLPEEVLRRPKSGFQLDAPAFFDAHLRPLAEEYLSPARVRAHGLFNPDTVAAWRRLPPRRRWRWHFFLLYLMLLTHLWIEVFEEGG